jgi:hypothetical protein
MSPTRSGYKAFGLRLVEPLEVLGMCYIICMFMGGASYLMGFFGMVFSVLAFFTIFSGFLN